MSISEMDSKVSTYFDIQAQIEALQAEAELTQLRHNK